MSQRNERIAEEIKKVLSEEIRTTVSDKEPDLGMVTITEVEVTKENEIATAYFTSLNNNKEFVQDTLDKFNGLFRKAVATNIRLRKAPEIRSEERRVGKESRTRKPQEENREEEEVEIEVL